ncbi:NADH-ubiquinone oxidoreductase chain 4-like [Triticum aestivum]|uniref:NADH-ubiquinone oxidoreductase chain 4-like n=1 Tax=Triticum aestivum TaxID=4565 RepID=UPI001D02C4B2|nr:NADH-ubiquinone oxidoreductase chain 4-like [Triticum aestivum]
MELSALSELAAGVERRGGAALNYCIVHPTVWASHVPVGRGPRVEIGDMAKPFAGAVQGSDAPERGATTRGRAEGARGSDRGGSRGVDGGICCGSHGVGWGQPSPRRSGMKSRRHRGSKGKGGRCCGYPLELRPTTTGQFRFGATPDSTIIIGVWGSRQRKIKAAYQFFLYTLLGSVFMLLAILLILLQTGTTDLQILLTTEFSERRQILLWIAFFASFAVKVPMVPVHIWLPEAHVEAPTAGSVILAGILLKLGTYGFLRFSIPMFPEATLCFTPFIYTLSAIAIIYTSLTTLRQIDLKKIIAYSSVAHMNLVTIGMFSPNIQGIGGSILLMLSHGLVSSALFLCVGVLYDRHKTRLVRYYGGLVSTMPNFSTIFFFFTLANMSLPDTSSFIGEFLILVGAFQRNSLVATLAALGMILGVAYSLWLYNRVVSGNLKPDFLYKFSDLNGREVSIFLPFLVGGATVR